jgi:hypothetical protein
MDEAREQVPTGGEPGVQGEQGERRRTREYRISGIADLLPDWLLPQEGKQHVRAARRELLLAARSTLDAWIERNERGMTVRRGPTRIEIE